MVSTSRRAAALHLSKKEGEKLFLASYKLGKTPKQTWTVWPERHLDWKLNSLKSDMFRKSPTTVKGQNSSLSLPKHSKSKPKRSLNSHHIHQQKKMAPYWTALSILEFFWNFKETKSSILKDTKHRQAYFAIKLMGTEYISHSLGTSRFSRKVRWLSLIDCLYKMVFADSIYYL